MVYEESAVNEKLKNFALDCESGKLIMLMKYQKGTVGYELDARVYKLKIFDLATSTIELDQEIRDENLIGMILQGYNKFVNGNFYHHNSLTTMRYDLIKKAMDG